MKELLSKTFSVQTYHILFITPTLLVGANQKERELRGASFRGALRWWFRLLGGTPTEECDIFGGLGKPPKASKIIVRCTAKHEHLRSGKVLKEELNTPGSYLSFFAESSQKKGGAPIGPRVTPEAYFAANSQITLEIVERHPLTPDQRKQLSEAVEAMINFGSIGYRATRTYGALAPITETSRGISYDALITWANLLEKKGIYLRTLSTEHIADWEKSRDILATFLKNLRASDSSLDGKGAVSPLGSASPERHTSALRLRPVLLDNGSYMPIVIYSDNACNLASIWDKHLKNHPDLKPIK